MDLPYLCIKINFDNLYLFYVCLQLSHGPDCIFVGPCNEDEFYCGSSKCIPKSWICDKEEDCEDGRDEQACGQ